MLLAAAVLEIADVDESMVEVADDRDEDETIVVEIVLVDARPKVLATILDEVDRSTREKTIPRSVAGAALPSCGTYMVTRVISGCPVAQRLPRVSGSRAR